MDSLTIGLLTVSDTCFQNEKEDTAGPRLLLEIKQHFPVDKCFKKIVPDEVGNIVETLDLWIKYECNIIFTIGGTGFSPRDVTPEATRAVIEKEAPGIAYAMIAKSLATTEMAMLSRAVCGIKSKSLIINLPGSAKAAIECFGFIKSSLSHAVALLTDNKNLVTKVHTWIQDNEKTEPILESGKQEIGSVVSVNQTKSKVKLNNPANRKRKSPYPMVEVKEALDMIFHEAIASRWEEIPFDTGLNRVLAEEIYSEVPVPPFRASIKDGYAVRASDGIGERTVRDVTAAGDAPCQEKLMQGEVIRISTGAPIPAGADAVVQVEDTTLIEKSRDGSQELKIKINVAPAVGQDIREIGSDVAAGQLVLSKFDRISPAYIGVLAMLGKTKVKVFKRHSVGIVSTGNELKSPYENLKPGQIRDSNKFALISLLKKYGYDSNDCGVANDDPDSVKFALEKALASNDIIITTGGVSMGEYDIVKPVLEDDFDAFIHFARVNMKPGKPTTFATLQFQGQHKLVFALPGNPVSCCVTSLLFVIPTLRYLEKSKVINFPIVSASAPGLINNDGRPEYHRVKIWFEDGRFFANSTGKQISSRLNSLANANGLAIVRKTDQKGMPKDVILFDDL